MAGRQTGATTTVADDEVRTRANQGWDEAEIHWRERTWSPQRWALEARWPRGMRVRVTSGDFAGVCGTVSSNRVYASDNGAWVRLEDGDVGLVHWSDLAPVDDAQP